MTEYEYLKILSDLHHQFNVLNNEYEAINKEAGSYGKLERSVSLHEFKKFAISQKKFADEMMKRRNEYE